MRKSVLTSAAFGFALLTLTLTGTYASAATITWGAATTANFAAVTDFSTAGTFYDSGTIYPTADLVIGTTPSITMHHRDTAAGSNPFSFVGSSFISGTNGAASSFGTQIFDAVATNNYMKMVQYGTQSAGTFTLTLSGLTSGREYQVQVWTPIWNQAGTYTTFTAGNSVTLRVGETLTGPSGPITTNPQFSLGTFTANAATQAITYTRTNSGGTPVGGGSFFGAIQVRDITPAPEPGSFGIMIIGLVGVTRVLRQRRLHR